MVEFIMARQSKRVCLRSMHKRYRSKVGLVANSAAPKRLDSSACRVGLSTDREFIESALVAQACEPIFFNSPLRLNDSQLKFKAWGVWNSLPLSRRSECPAFQEFRRPSLSPTPIPEIDW